MVSEVLSMFFVMNRSIFVNYRTYSIESKMSDLRDAISI